MKHTCRCTCTAYGGRCDCFFDGTQQGASEERAATVAWLRANVTMDDWGGESIAQALLNGEHRRPTS